MLDEYLDLQPVVYKVLHNAVFKNRLSHAYLFESNGYPKTMDVAIAFAKLIFCEQHFTNLDKCEQCNLCEQINTGNFPELRIITPINGVIKKEQLYDLQQEFSKKAMIGNRKVYIIQNAECLNASSSNALLKFLEEPEENIIAILITDNIYNLLDTIVSRCQVVSFCKMKTQEIDQYHEYDSIMVKLGIRYFSNENDLKSFLEVNDFSVVNNVLNFIDYYETHGIQSLLFANKIWHEHFKDKETISFAFHIIILYYKDVLNYLYQRELCVFDTMIDKIQKVASNNSIVSIGAKIQVFLKMKENVMSNMNLSLLFDKMIIMLEEVHKYV